MNIKLNKIELRIITSLLRAEAYRYYSMDPKHAQYLRKLADKLQYEQGGEN